MSESSVVVVGAAGAWRDAVSAAVGGVTVEALTEDAAAARVVVVLATEDSPADPSADGPHRWSALAAGVVHPLEQARRAHASLAGADGTVVLVTGDPEHGTASSRTHAAAVRSLATSLAVEWAPSTAVVAVTAGPSTPAASVAAACRFAQSAPSGTVVALGST